MVTGARATGRSRSRPVSRRRGARARWRVVLIVVAVLAGMAFWFREPIGGYSTTATAYAAHIGCSCHFIGGRDLRQCRSDLEPGMGVVMLSSDDGAKSVTARIPLLSAQTATWRKGQGCVLQPYED